MNHTSEYQVAHFQLIYVDLQVDLLPQIYQILGRNMHEDKGNETSFVLAPSSTQQELKAFTKLSTDCPFVVDAQMMIREYSEFSTRKISGFEFHWHGDQVDFTIILL